MLSEPICPKCGDTIEQFVTFEEFYDDEVFELLVGGECPKCGQQYSWREVYRYYGVKELEEVNE